MAQRRELVGLAHAQLEADRLAARQLSELLHELYQLRRRPEGRVARRRRAVREPGPVAQTSRFRDEGRNLGGGQDAAVRGLGALACVEIKILRRVLLNRRVVLLHAIDAAACSMA